MGPGETLAMLFVFSVPLSVIWTHHKRKVLELQLRLKQEGDAGVRAAVEAMREEMRALRDTTMQYDISFDNALQRMEQRVENLERNAQAASTDEIAHLRAGR
jgi:hypothetical protein